MRIFVAGATGAIGRPLVHALRSRGHEVTGMTRTPDKATWLERCGVRPVVCDALDTDRMGAAVRGCEPEVVIDQLTDLPSDFNVLRFGRFYARQIPLKEVAAPALLRAAVEVGARRHLMQSIAFLYAPGGAPVKTEEDPAWSESPPPWDAALPPFAVSEAEVTGTERLEGIVLRYGFFYGPGTHFGREGSIAREVRRRRYPIVGDGGGVYSFIHVDDAAEATVVAAEDGSSGIYNVVDDRPCPVRTWLPAYARVLGARAPRRVPRALARLTVGAIPVHLSTTVSGASNAKIKSELGWKPRHPDPVDGLRAEVG